MVLLYEDRSVRRGICEQALNRWQNLPSYFDWPEAPKYPALSDLTGLLPFHPLERMVVNGPLFVWYLLEVSSG